MNAYSDGKYVLFGQQDVIQHTQEVVDSCGGISKNAGSINYINYGQKRVFTAVQETVIIISNWCGLY